MTSAEQGDIVGTHWIGVFYHEGFGVVRNVEKAVSYL
jgi:TPR repeat protein